MKDTRIFRVTKKAYGNATKLSYCTRTAVSGMFSTSLYDHRQINGGIRPDILTVEATNAEATDGWTDVTDEFRNKPQPNCVLHKTYTGVRKPDVWSWDGTGNWLYRSLARCKCPVIYAAKHPEYPVHDSLCNSTLTDPADCMCKMITRLLE